MSLCVQQVHYQNFRNIQDKTLDLSSGLTVLVGHNAAGKTNCLEGIQLLTDHDSFRHPRPQELISHGQETGSLSCVIVGQKRRVDIMYKLHPTRKVLYINGKHRSSAEEDPLLPSVLFFPDDLMIIKGSSQMRRDMIDDYGSSINTSYKRIVRDYRRCLYQRNTLLKEASKNNCSPDPSLLEAWTHALAHTGSHLFIYRSSLVARLNPHVQRMYQHLAPHESCELTYKSAYAPVTPDNLSQKDMEEILTRALFDNQKEDERRAQTTIGPHLDDLGCMIDSTPARTFASQGQQRSFILALKLAQVDLIHELLGVYPVFLLDDVMSELDITRKKNLFSLLNQDVQTIITTTDQADVHLESSSDICVVEMI